MSHSGRHRKPRRLVPWLRFEHGEAVWGCVCVSSQIKQIFPPLPGERKQSLIISDSAHSAAAATARGRSLCARGRGSRAGRQAGPIDRRGHGHAAGEGGRPARCTRQRQPLVPRPLRRKRRARRARVQIPEPPACPVLTPAARSLGFPRSKRVVSAGPRGQVQEGKEGGASWPAWLRGLSIFP